MDEIAVQSHGVPFEFLMGEPCKEAAMRKLVAWELVSLDGVMETRLFGDGGDRKALELVDSKTFGTGVLYLTYRPAQGRSH